MKRIVAGMLAAGPLVWVLAQTVNTPRPLSEVVPAGAMIYLEAKNFSGLVADWNGSREKTTWLSSANYQVFSRSALFGRLGRVFEEYASGVGVAPDLSLLTSVAGTESALAVYDINKIEFLYITRLPSARAMESLLWKSRDKFTARNVGGSAYYVKTDTASKRTAGFAISGDWLLVATREDALAGALSLLGRRGGNPVRREAWFDAALRAAPQAGDLRMMLNLPRAAATPAFRSYWVQGNAAELRTYSASVSDLRRTAGEWREERVLLRAEAGTAPDVSALPALAAMAPEDAGLYRVWAQPSPSAVLELFSSKVLVQGPRGSMLSKTAPSVSIETWGAGSESDLETRIDDAPFDFNTGGYRAEPVYELLAANTARAALLVQSSRMAQDGVFVVNDAAVVVEGANDWDAAAVRRAVTAAVQGLYTRRELGLEWREQNAVWTTAGLARIAVAVRGKRLLLSTSADLAAAMLARPAGAAMNASYAARFRVTGEGPRFQGMARMIERSEGDASSNGEPRFFADNLASLVDVLRRVDRVDIREQDTGALVRQTVAYRLAR